MANEVIYSDVFIKKAKIYKKKYLSLVDDLRTRRKTFRKS